MQGLMQDWPLTVDKILDHACAVHGQAEVVTRNLDGSISRSTYAQVHARAGRLSSALLGLGVRLGDRVGTLAWNTAAHMEAWYAVMGMGAVCHTINPRLLPTQLGWMTDHAGEKVLFADACFAPLLGPVLAGAPGVEHLVWLTDEAGCPPFDAPGGVKVHCLETLLEQHPDPAPWGGFDEGTAAGLCYTSGTTGDPKGVLYSHRSNVLHAMITMQADIIGMRARDTVLAVVPMFHANAWGLPYSVPATGAKLVMPGARLDGASIHELIEQEQVTFSAAVPTVWSNLLGHLRETGKRIDSLKSVIIGGSAVNQAMMQAYQDEYGVEVIHAWGMTETSPMGAASRLTVRTAALDEAGQMAVRMKQGRPPLGVELKIVDETGATLPHDGEAFGPLMVRGPAVASAYFRSEQKILDADGYFDTGDIATIDQDGFMQITDRAKDVIKSGGEWISSIEIENHVLAHPAVESAAVVGVAHPKWLERPVLLCKLREGQAATPAELLTHLDGKIAKWWMPDDVLFRDAIPLGATGKVDKKALRVSRADYQLPTDEKPPVLAAAAAAAVIYAPEPEPEEAAAEPEPAASEPAPEPDDKVVLVEAAMAPFPVQSEMPPEPEAPIGPFPAGAPEPVVEATAAEAPAVAETPAVESPAAEPPLSFGVRPAPPPAAQQAVPKPSASKLDQWRPRLELGLRIVSALGIAGALLTIVCGLLAPAYLDEAYKVEVAVLAFALIGFVCALGLDWKAFSRNAMIALTIALFGLGLALVFSAAWQPRGQFPEVAQTAP